jgi:hypothetical protein
MIKYRDSLNKNTMLENNETNKIKIAELEGDIKNAFKESDFVKAKDLISSLKSIDPENSFSKMIENKISGIEEKK